ncbi:MAG: hypothetical protein HQL79_12225 [Magnetococcales bacterium]|nr:hypothetical protein [Magnetococcales bacterium]
MATILWIIEHTVSLLFLSGLADWDAWESYWPLDCPFSLILQADCNGRFFFGVSSVTMVAGGASGVKVACPFADT